MFFSFVYLCNTVPMSNSFSMVRVISPTLTRLNGFYSACDMHTHMCKCHSSWTNPFTYHCKSLIIARITQSFKFSTHWMQHGTHVHFFYNLRPFQTFTEWYNMNDHRVIYRAITFGSLLSSFVSLLWNFLLVPVNSQSSHHNLLILTGTASHFILWTQLTPYWIFSSDFIFTL